MLRRFGQPAEPVVVSDVRLSSPSWRPDGSLLAFQRHGPEGTTLEMAILSEPVLVRSIESRETLSPAPVSWRDRMQMLYGANGQVRKRGFEDRRSMPVHFRAVLASPPPAVEPDVIPRQLEIIDAPDDRLVVRAARMFDGIGSFYREDVTSFIAHPYRHPIVGWLSDLRAVDVAACREFFDTYYAANNLTITVAGDFSTEEVLRQIEAEFGDLPRAETIPRNPTKEPRQTGERRATVHFDVAGPILTMAWHAPPSGHEDAEALDVLSGVLSGGRASRLYRRMVYGEDAVALGARGVYYEFDDAGLFYAGVQVRPGQSVEGAERIFLEEIERIRTEMPDEAEVDRARRALEVGISVGQGSAHALAGRMGREWVTFGRIRPLAERLEKVRAVTPDDVRRVAQKYLVPEGRTVVTVVPPVTEEGSS